MLPFAFSFIEEIQRRLMPMEADGAGGEGTGNGLAKMDETPFELRALEVALDVVRVPRLVEPWIEVGGGGEVCLRGVLSKGCGHWMWIQTW